MDLILAGSREPAAPSLQERIRHALERDILTGARPPGSAIDEKALAAQFQASRTPVREALLLLAAQGLVQIEPRAGIRVRKASTAELVATLEALCELEAVLAGLAARRATEAQRLELQQALAAAHACATGGDRRHYGEANAQLHEVIYRASGNPVLVGQVRSVRKTLAAYRLRSFDKPGRLAVSDREHARVVQAIVRGDDRTAAEAMREHIGAGGEAMVALVLAAEAVAAMAAHAAPAPVPAPASTPARRRKPAT